MPTIIDSLFLELGVDTSKFNKQQQAALAKIAEFEKRSKKGAKGAAQAVKTVGEAFRDIASDSRIGRSAQNLDTFATKLKALGRASQVSGGMGTPLGKMAEGMGALLSPTTLALAAVTLLGKGVWDFDKKMTAANATIFRQAQLSGMNAKRLYAWGEAAKIVGGSPQDITGGISSLQTAVTGMGIGAGNASAQLIALARLGGVGWNFKSGVNVPQLFERVHELAAARGYQNLGALRALTMPLMNGAMWALATSPTFDPNHIEAQIKRMEPKSFGEILAGAVKSQEKLGLLGASKDTLMQRAYGATQNVFDTMAVGIQQLVGYVSAIYDFISHPLQSLRGGKPIVSQVGHVSESGKLPAFQRGFLGRRALAMRALMGNGMSRADAAAIVGNAIQESSLNPTATNDHGAHIGLLQLDAQRQQQFARTFGYRIGTKSIAARKQFLDQLLFAQIELKTTQQEAARKMAAARGIMAKTAAFYNYDERPGASDRTLGKRVAYARQAFTPNAVPWARGGPIGLDPEAIAASRYTQAVLSGSYARHVVTHNVRHETHIGGGVHVHTPATDPEAHVNAVRKGLSTHPLIGPTGQHETTLATSAIAG